jgi:hypothetical protein
MIMRHIPYVQANFVLGLDCDEGPEPFDLTKRFVDLTPGVFPAYSLLTAFGQAAALNLDYQRERRVLPHPFFLLNNHGAMNVIPKNYSWTELYDRVVDVTEHSYSWRAIGRRFRANTGLVPSLMNVVRAVANEGSGRVRYYREVRGLLDTDSEIQRYFHGQTTTVPQFYQGKLRRSLGSFHQHLPAGAVEHDQNAYLNATATTSIPIEVLRSSAQERSTIPA